MGDELRGESLVHLNVRFSTETELNREICEYAVPVRVQWY